jgi:hypothetical protein
MKRARHWRRWLLWFALASAVAACSQVQTFGGDATGGGEPEVCGEVEAEGPTECPAEWTPELADGEPCSMPKGTTCMHRNPMGGWFAVTCGCFVENEFTGYGVSGGSPSCPAEPAPNGSSCDDAIGVCFYFPNTICSCQPSGTWECGPDSAGTDWPCVSMNPPNTNASGIAPETPVKDLSTAEATAWCAWYENAFGGGAVPDYPVTDGYAWGGAVIGCAVDVGCVQHITVEHCVQNLSISSCTARLIELEECARTVMNQCLLVGHGCTALHGCGCDTTIVQAGYESSDCRVPVE